MKSLLIKSGRRLLEVNPACLHYFRRFIAENVAACSKCCGKDDDEESLTTGSRGQDYAALQ